MFKLPVILIVILYALASIGYYHIFINKQSGIYKIATRLYYLAVSIHITYIIMRVILLKHLPFTTIFEAFITLSLALGIIYLYLEIATGTKTTGVFFLPLLFGFNLVSTIFIDNNTNVKPIFKSVLFGFHTGASLLAYSALFISAVYSVLYLILLKELQKKQFNIFYSKLPSLEIMDNFNAKAMLAGTFFLIAGILFGFIWAVKGLKDNPIFDPKFTVAVLTVAVYTLATICRLFFGWHGRRTAYLSVIGFGLILFSMLIVNLFTTSFHSFVK